MKGCKDCEERERMMYEAQAAFIRPANYFEQYSNPQDFSNISFVSGSNLCSICDKESSHLFSREYGIEYTYFLKYKDREYLNFKNICKACDDYIVSAAAEDVLELHKELSKKNSPLRQKQEKKGWFKWSM
jgi:hypothetical protein